MRNKSSVAVKPGQMYSPPPEKRNASSCSSPCPVGSLLEPPSLSPTRLHCNSTLIPTKNIILIFPLLCCYYNHADLPDSSVDAVIAAQCFHWFANNKSLSQIQRVLVPGGKLGLIWNSWDDSFPWIKELNEEVILPSYWETNTPYEISYEWKKVLDASGKFLPVEGDESQFKSEQFFSFEEFIDRLTSVSVIQVKNSSEKELMKKRVKLIWNKYNEKNKLVFPHVVKIYWAERK